MVECSAQFNTAFLYIRDNIVLPGSQDSSVGIATGYGLDGRGSIPVRCKRLSVFHSVQTGPGVHLASGVLSPGVKSAVREADHSPPASAEVQE
jgi:hypothetical protein